MEELIAEEKQKELERLEKGDVKAMILAAMITIFPICLGPYSPDLPDRLFLHGPLMRNIS